MKLKKGKVSCMSYPKHRKSRLWFKCEISIALWSQRISFSIIFVYDTLIHKVL